MTMTKVPGILIERTFKAAPDEVWAMWITKEGLEKWWGPVGFASIVKHLDVRVGGSFEIVMRAIGPDQIAFLKSAGLPLESSAKGTYTDVVPVQRLSYHNIIDFIPGVPHYDVESSLELKLTPDGGTKISFRSGAMHDSEWTQRAEMGWSQQIGKFVAVLP